MPFIADILRHRSVSIVGLEKNSGKTECLNYILSRLPESGHVTALSSIGVDGERNDSLTGGVKPSVRVRRGTIFATSEQHLRRQGIVAEILDISDDPTALGRVVTARALCDGEVLLSGPSSTPALGRWIEGLSRFGVELILVDGALSRMSAASPSVTESMILSTGAAYSTDLTTLTRQTAFVVEKIESPLADASILSLCECVGSGVWAIDKAGCLDDMQLASTLLASDRREIPADCNVFYIAGALTNGFTEWLLADKRIKSPEIVVQDFTKIFLSQSLWRRFKAAGGRISVLRRSNLIAVCVNPVSPSGIVLDSDKLCEKLSAAIGLPVYDIIKNADPI